jgi:hypothetical protein
MHCLHRTTFTIQIGDSALIIVGNLMIQNTDNRDTGREGAREATDGLTRRCRDSRYRDMCLYTGRAWVIFFTSCRSPLLFTVDIWSVVSMPRLNLPSCLLYSSVPTVQTFHYQHLRWASALVFFLPLGPSPRIRHSTFALWQANLTS